MAKFRTFFLCCCRMVWVSHITAVGEVYPKLFSVHRLREMKVNFVLCLFLSLLLLLLFCYCYCFFVIFCLHWIFNTIMLHWSLNFEFAFSVLTLLVWHEKEHSACKKIKWWGVEVMGCGNLSGVRCRFAYGPADAMPLHTKTLLSLALFKSRLVLPFWYWLIQVLQEKMAIKWV